MGGQAGMQGRFDHRHIEQRGGPPSDETYARRSECLLFARVRIPADGTAMGSVVQFNDREDAGIFGTDYKIRS